MDWPIGYDDRKPCSDMVDVLPGCSGTTDGLVQVPDSVPSTYRLTCMRHGRRGRRCDINAAFHSPTSAAAS